MPTYAGFVTRAIGLTIDNLVLDLVAVIFSGAVLLVLSVFSVSGHKHRAVTAVIASVLFVIWIVSYFGVFWTTTGQTVGSRVMSIRVTRSDGTRLKPRHALLRLGAMVISLPLFWGYLPILTSARRRGVPDVVGGTVVIVVPPVSGVEPSGSGRVVAAADGHAHTSGIEPSSTVPSPGVD